MSIICSAENYMVAYTYITLPYVTLHPSPKEKQHYLDSQHPAYRYLRTHADSGSSVAHVHLTVRHCQSLQWSYDAARIRP